MDTRDFIWFHAGLLITRSAPEAHEGSHSGLPSCFGMGSGVSKDRRGSVLRTIKKAPAKDCYDLR